MQSTPENEHPGGAIPLSLTCRLVISFLIAMIVVGLSLYTAWQQFSSVLARNGDPGHSLIRMKYLERELDRYQQEEHRFPSDLSKLRTGTEPYLRDAWNHPFIYRTDGKRYEIVSLGQDGRPGGEGSNYDLSSDEFVVGALIDWREFQDKVKLTFPQFVAHEESWRMLTACLLGGVIAFVLGYRTLSPRPAGAPRRSWYSYALRLLGIAFAALLVSFVMSLLHAAGMAH